MNELSCDVRTARKAFSRIGFALTAIILVATAGSLLWIVIPELVFGEDNWFHGTSWGMWLGNFLPMYLLAIPACLLILRKLPAQKPEDHPMGAKNAFVIFAISICVMYAGNLVGTMLSSVLSGGTAENVLTEYAMDTNPLKYLFMVILAPLLEEYVCRKQIIDRTRQYGEKTAVLLSGLTFGLLHQNLFQFFYAFGLGVVFGYVYIRTGRLRYPVVLHGIVNFMGSVIAPWLLSQLDMEAMANLDPSASPETLLLTLGQILPGLLATLAYSLFLLGMSVTGLALLIQKSKRLIWHPGDLQLPEGTAAKTVYRNAGMIVYMALCAAVMVWSLVG